MRPSILFLCTAPPLGNSGAGVRTRQIAKTLHSLGQVTIVGISNRPWSKEQIAQAKAEFDVARTITYQPWPHVGFSGRVRQVLDPQYLNSNAVQVAPSDREFVDDLIRQRDVTWIHTLKIANSFQRLHWNRSVMDVDDIPSRYHTLAAAQAATVGAKLKRWRNAFAEKRRERLCLDRFDVLTVCKESDREHFDNDPRVHVVPNGFATPESVAPRSIVPGQPRLGMIGHFEHLPNLDGLKWFASEVWPHVRSKVPSAELRLVGKGSDSLSQKLNVPQIKGLGFVHDVAQEMATWSGMIVPTRLGGGTHLKVAEGLARRVPIVMTPHGARGYDVSHGCEALIAESSSEFAIACQRILLDPALGNRLAEAGWRLFNTRYSWESIAPTIAATVDHCLALNPKLADAALS
ncbi:MAG TPA: glycosyltransferase family 4 protein [Verrucomicrobiae bacterium]|nr:glycosyltransferase family 4 protein [Verrucomicrobiae bacterium]